MDYDDLQRLMYVLSAGRPREEDLADLIDWADSAAKMLNALRQGLEPLTAKPIRQINKLDKQFLQRAHQVIDEFLSGKR